MMFHKPPPIDPILLSYLRDRINNPLAAIDMEAQLLLMSEAAARSPEVCEAAEHIIVQCGRIAAVLHSLRHDKPVE
jgi:signal transduction histidine kinase